MFLFIISLVEYKLYCEEYKYIYHYSTYSSTGLNYIYYNTKFNLRICAYSFSILLLCLLYIRVMISKFGLTKCKQSFNSYFIKEYLLYTPSNKICIHALFVSIAFLVITYYKNMTVYSWYITLCMSENYILSLFKLSELTVKFNYGLIFVILIILSLYISSKMKNYIFSSSCNNYKYTEYSTNYYYFMFIIYIIFSYAIHLYIDLVNNQIYDYKMLITKKYIDYNFSKNKNYDIIDFEKLIKNGYIKNIPKCNCGGIYIVKKDYRKTYRDYGCSIHGFVEDHYYGPPFPLLDYQPIN